MKEEIQTAIKTLAGQITASTKPLEAMQITQAILNLTNALSQITLNIE